MQNIKPQRVLSAIEAVGPQVYRILREQIIQAELVPGARISEAEIARSLSISRQPVREAFIKLASPSRQRNLKVRSVAENILKALPSGAPAARFES